MTSFSRMATGLYLKKIEKIKMFFKRFDLPICLASLTQTYSNINTTNESTVQI